MLPPKARTPRIRTKRHDRRRSEGRSLPQPAPAEFLESSGGDFDHGEEIELVELKLDEALNMVETGEIQDGKTIMLLRHAKVKRLVE